MSEELRYYNIVIAIADNMVERGQPSAALEFLRKLGVRYTGLAPHWKLKQRSVEASCYLAMGEYDRAQQLLAQAKEDWV